MLLESLLTHFSIVLSMRMESGGQVWTTSANPLLYSRCTFRHTAQARTEQETTTTSSPRAHGSWAHSLPCLLVKSLLVLQEWLYTYLVALATPLYRNTPLLKCWTLDQVLLFFLLLLHTIWNFCTSTDKLQYREVLIKPLAFSSNRLS